MEMFRFAADIRINHVPFKGSAEAHTQLIGGQIPVMFDAIPATLPHIKSGRLRGLAVTSAQPSAMAPGLPTMASAGLPGYECVGKYAVFAPAKTPARLVELLNREIVRVLNRQDVTERFHAASTEVIASTPAELTAAMKAEMARMGKVIRAAGIKIE